jgi:cbb3-type cytochrome oxidase subunit 3
MEPRTVGFFIAIFVSIFTAMFLAMFAAFDSENKKSAARASRLAEHRMNARLLRLDI